VHTTHRGNGNKPQLGWHALRLGRLPAVGSSRARPTIPTGVFPQFSSLAGSAAASHTWCHKGIAMRSLPMDDSGDIKKDAVY
jgi:hypothetical protein